MGAMCREEYGEYLRGRNALKTTSNTQFLKTSGLVTLKKEYQPSLFLYLVDSCHIDPESLLPYRTTRVYVRKGRIVCDRILVSSEDAQQATKKKKHHVETIHAMDVVLFTLVSNPLLKSSLLTTGESLANFIASLHSDFTVVSAPTKPHVSKKRIRVEEPSILEEPPVSVPKLDRISDPRLKDSPQFFNHAAKLRRSDRLKVLTTKVYLIRDRKDVDNLETIYAEDITIPKSHVQATKSAFVIQWTKAEESEITGLKRKDTYEIVDEINVPPGTKIIPGKWVYAIKVDSNGKVVRFKARLTARGD